jgi:serine/threonine-protein kinase
MRSREILAEGVSMNDSTLSLPPERIGRYVLYPAIARGGMATVHPARLVGAEGFTRLVAAKRLHPHFADDPDFATMFHDEACIASMVHHPNVVSVLDVVVAGRELILVQEYVHGVPLAHLLKVCEQRGTRLPTDIVIAILVGILAGLHAAHEARDNMGNPLEIVHRDVSPQNIMVSVDGSARLLDFGIAKARTSTHHTREGVFKGKLAYMAPEQLRMERIDRTVDVYATGILAWEMLVNRRIYDGRDEVTFVRNVVHGNLPSILEALTEHRFDEAMDIEHWTRAVALAPVVAKAMAAGRDTRFTTAEAMMHALLELGGAASAMRVAEWVRATGASYLDERQNLLVSNEESWRRTTTSPPPAMPRHPWGEDLSDPSVSSASISSHAPVACTVHSSLPPSVSFATEPPRGREESSTASPSTKLGRLAARMRATRAMPWLALSVIFALAGTLGNLAGRPNPASGAPGLKVEGALAAHAAAAPSTAPPASDASPPNPPPSVSVQYARTVAPPSSSPPSWRGSLSRPSVPFTSTSSTAPKVVKLQADCNPPFYFEGTKKLFKPNCL